MRVERTTVETSMNDLIAALLTYGTIPPGQVEDPKTGASVDILKAVIGHYLESDIILVKEADRVIGFAVHRQEDDWGSMLWVHELASLTDTPGVGTALMEELKAIGRERGCTRIGLYARKEAIGFYEKLGFRKEQEAIMVVDL